MIFNVWCFTRVFFFNSILHVVGDNIPIHAVRSLMSRYNHERSSYWYQHLQARVQMYNIIIIVYTEIAWGRIIPSVSYVTLTLSYYALFPYWNYQPLDCTMLSHENESARIDNSTRILWHTFDLFWANQLWMLFPNVVYLQKISKYNIIVRPGFRTHDISHSMSYKSDSVPLT